MTKKYDFLNKEIAYPIIARFMKSGMLSSEFYKKEGLSEAQFYSWRKRYMKDHPGAYIQSATPHPSAICKPAIVVPAPKPATAPNAESQVSFHPIQVSSLAEQSAAEKDHQIELEYPNGVILRVDESLNDVRLVSLIKIY